jgi:glycosyltransferase involved in cell wall biosynthesis
LCAGTGDPIFPLGAVDDDRLKAIVYSSADLYVHAAQADNLPNMVLESMACGTPVVAFPIGGLPDMVRPGVSGWLSADPNSGGLSDALGQAFRALRQGQTLRDECRNLAEAEYAEPLQAQGYLSVYSALVREAFPNCLKLS